MFILVITGEKRMIHCCKDCTPETGRHAGCHATCSAYLMEKENHITEKRMINQKKYESRQIMGYFAEDKERRRRRYS